MTEITASSAPPGSPPSGRAPVLSLRRVLGGSGVRWLLALPILFLCLLLVVPMAFIVVDAFSGSQTLEGTGASYVLSDDVFQASLLRTVLLALTVAVLTLVFGTVYALALVVAPRGVMVLLLVALFTIFWTSLLVRTYGWILLLLPTGGLYTILHELGLREQPLDVYQTTLASYPAMVHVMLPYVVLPVYAAARQIDPLHVPAARVLGARPLLILRKVVLPQLRTGMMAGAVIVFIFSLGFYITPTLLGGPTNPMVATLIGIAFNSAGRIPVAAGMSVALLLTVLIVYAIADRWFKISEHWGSA